MRGEIATGVEHEQRQETDDRPLAASHVHVVEQDIQERRDIALDRHDHLVVQRLVLEVLQHPKNDKAQQVEHRHVPVDDVEQRALVGNRELAEQSEPRLDDVLAGANNVPLDLPLPDDERGEVDRRVLLPEKRENAEEQRGRVEANYALIGSEVLEAHVKNVVEVALLRVDELLEMLGLEHKDFRGNRGGCEQVPVDWVLEIVFLHGERLNGLLDPRIDVDADAHPHHELKKWRRSAFDAMLAEFDDGATARDAIVPRRVDTRE